MKLISGSIVNSYVFILTFVQSSTIDKNCLKDKIIESKEILTGLMTWD